MNLFCTAVTVLIASVAASLTPTPVPTSQASAAAVVSVTDIPVLAYHGIDSGDPGTADADADVVTLADFTAQMARLHDLGYHTISPEQYLAWTVGETRSLPTKPFLLTFDDNRASALDAMPAVAKYGFRPVMYVATGFADGGYGSFYMSWLGVFRLASAGWYLQLHAGPCGHAYLTASSPYGCADGLTIGGDAQTGHRFYPLPDGQSDAAYRARVERDVQSGLSSLRDHMGYSATWRSATFAVPWDDWGQPDTSGQPWLSHYFATNFTVVFVEDSYPGDQRASPLRMRYRFQVGRATTLVGLVGALADPRFHAPKASSGG